MNDSRQVEQAVKTLVFFNNKGGVGKTTLTCNVASFLNLHKGKRVLLIDADPQCNATQVLLNDEVLADVYATPGSGRKTLYTYLKPLEDGEPVIATDTAPLAGGDNKFGTDLIPGHPRLSLIEDRLSRAWTDIMGGEVGGYRITNWPSQLHGTIGNQYDLIIYDVGPSLGALNRTVLLSADYIVTPFGSDIFSLMGVENIAAWMDAWSKDYQHALAYLEGKHRGATTRYPGILHIERQFRLAGYSVQQYVMRKFKKGPRPVRAYDAIMADIPSAVQRTLAPLIPENLSAEDLSLGHIPFLYSLAPLAQSNRAPIHELVKIGAVTGNQYRQVDDYIGLMNSFCEKLLRNVGLAR